MKTMLRGWWTSLLCTKRCKIAVCSPSINHGRWVLACSLGCLWILKCNLLETKRKEDPTFEIIEKQMRETKGKCHWKTKESK